MKMSNSLVCSEYELQADMFSVGISIRRNHCDSADAKILLGRAPRPPPTQEPKSGDILFPKGTTKMC